MNLDVCFMQHRKNNTEVCTIISIGATIRSNIGMIPWQNMDKELRTSLANLLPLDAHVIATEKLFVSVTSLKNLKPANEVRD